MKTTKNLPLALQVKYQDNIKYVAAHQHFVSINDSVQDFNVAAKRAVELGATAICITDHGTAMGIDDFNAAALKHKLKPIFGVEAYLYDDELESNSHLCLYAKDNEGLRQMFMTLARGEFLKDGRCILHRENLEGLRGGHFIATSACIGGVLGSVILHNLNLQKKIDDLAVEVKASQHVLDMYEKLSREVDNAKANITLMKAEISADKKVAKTPFTSKLKGVENMKKKLEKAQTAFDKFVDDGKPASWRSAKSALAGLSVMVEDADEFEDAMDRARMLIQQQEAQVAAEQRNVQAVADGIAAKEYNLEMAKAQLESKKEALELIAKDASKAQTKKNKMEEYQSQILTEDAITRMLRERVELMVDVFGKDFYVEMQYHGIDKEAIIYPRLFELAREYNLPLIAANDSHITYNTEEEMMIRQIRRSCRFNKWEERQVGDEEMYVKNDRELATALYQILPEDAVVEAMNNVKVLVEQCNAYIEKGSHAPKAKVNNVRDEVIAIARANIMKKYGKSWGKTHEERFNYEIDIIDSMGFSDYFYITWDILNTARKIGALSYKKLDELKTKMDNMTMDELMAFLDAFGTDINLSVGLGRGSGAGSIVCYLLGITNIDPLKYDLLFERKKDCVH